MSSKKKDLDNELSDVSSEEENIVKFAKKKGDKTKINTKEKILSKKLKEMLKKNQTQNLNLLIIKRIKN